MNRVAKIKTRETVKDIKVFDRTANISKHMKDTFIKSKDTAEQTQDSGEQSPENYASDKAMGSAERVTHKAVGNLKNPHKKASANISKTKENLQKSKQHIAEVKNAVKKPIVDQPKKEMVKQTQGNVRRTASHARTVSNTRNTANKSIKTVRKSERTIKQSAKTIKSTGKGIVKTTGKSVKTAEHTARTTIKTTQQTVKATSRAAQASAKAAKTAVQASKVAAKAAVQATKTAIKVTISTVKAIIAATKALITAIAAGGWIAVAIIFTIVIFGGVLALFGGSSGNSNSYTPVSAEVQAYDPLIQKYAKEHGIPEYVELIKAVMMQESGGRGNDPMQASECGYNTKYPNSPNGITDPEYSINVGIQNLAACLTLAKVESPIDMDNIKLCLQGYNFGNGYISWARDNHGGYTYANAVEFSTMMAAKYGWSKYGDTQYVAHVLQYYPYGRYPTGAGSQDLVQMALSQEGNVGGQPYWSWYGFGGRVEWCACFVSWCAEQCGYIESGQLPKFSLCTDGEAWFKSNGRWQDRNYVPTPGDIIFFDWDGDGNTSHVGIVVNATDGVVNTIEGNSGDQCRQRSYSVGSSSIYGYGVSAY